MNSYHSCVYTMICCEIILYHSCVDAMMCCEIILCHSCLYAMMCCEIIMYHSCVDAMMCCEIILYHSCVYAMMCCEIILHHSCVYDQICMSVRRPTSQVLLHLSLVCTHCMHVIMKLPQSVSQLPFALSQLRHCFFTAPSLPPHCSLTASILRPHFLITASSQFPRSLPLMLPPLQPCSCPGRSCPGRSQLLLPSPLTVTYTIARGRTHSGRCLLVTRTIH